MIRLKNLLPENMCRFKTKNLNEDDTMAAAAMPVDDATETAFINKLVNNRMLYGNDDDPNITQTEFKQIDTSFSDLAAFTFGNTVKYMGVFNHDKYDTSKSNELYVKFKLVDYPNVYIKLFAGGKALLHGKPAVKWWRFGGGPTLKYGSKRKFPKKGKSSVLSHKSKHDVRYAGPPGFDPKKK